MPILSRRISDTINKREPITDNKGEIELVHTHAHIMPPGIHPTKRPEPKNIRCP